MPGQIWNGQDYNQVNRSYMFLLIASCDIFLLKKNLRKKNHCDYFINLAPYIFIQHTTYALGQNI